MSRIEISLSSIRFAESIRIDYSQLYSLHLQVKGHSAQSLISWSVSLIVSDFTIKGSTVYLYKYIAQAAVSVDCNGLALFCDSPPLPVADLGFQQEGGRGGKISLSFFPSLPFLALTTGLVLGCSLDALSLSLVTNLLFSLLFLCGFPFR